MSDDKKIEAGYFSKDPWMLGFISDCLDIYGCPTDESVCVSREEEIWFMYSSMFLMGAIENMPGERLEELRQLSTRDAAYLYAKFYETMYSEPLVMPFAGKEEPQ